MVQHVGRSGVATQKRASELLVEIRDAIGAAQRARRARGNCSWHRGVLRTGSKGIGY